MATLPGSLGGLVLRSKKSPKKRRRPSIFISYARADGAQAAEVARALEGHQLSVFLDRDLQAGADWAHTLQLGIEQADKIVVLMSPDYFESRWCQAELAEAFRLAKPIIPVMSRPCEPTGPLQYLQWFNLESTSPSDLSRLAGAVAEVT